MAIPTNTTAIGGVTKKSQYDALYNNAILCDTGGTPGGAQSVPGLKTFTDGIHIDRVYSNTKYGIGMGHSDVESWDSSFFALEWALGSIAINSSGTINLTSNAYYDGAWKFKDDGTATDLRMSNTGLNFYYVAAGSENGTITWVKYFEIDPANNNYNLGGAAGGSDRNINIYVASDTYINWNEGSGVLAFYLEGGGEYTFSSTEFLLQSEQNIGSAAIYVDDVNCCDVIDRSAFYIPDKNTAYNLIKDLVNEKSTGFCSRCEQRGQMRLKYSMFPDYVFRDGLKVADKDIVITDDIIINKKSFEQRNMDIPVFDKNQIIAKKGEKTRYIIRNKNGKKELLYSAEGLSYTGIISYILAALQKTIENQEMIMKKLSLLGE